MFPNSHCNAFLSLRPRLHPHVTAKNESSVLSASKSCQTTFSCEVPLQMMTRQVVFLKKLHLITEE